MSRWLTRGGLLVLLILCLARTAAAQAGQQGSIQGTVTDSSGGAMPGVTVSAKSTSTNVTSTAVTGESGAYLIPSLVTGKYILTFTLSGFATDSREIEVRTGERLRIDSTLKVGSLTEEVKVVAETPLLQTASASRGTVIDSTVVDALPLGTRNPYSNLVMLAPGVVGETTNLQSLCCRPFDNGGMDNIVINGGVARTNQFVLNGASNTVREGNGNVGNLGFVPSPDAVQEVRIDTNSFDASQGRTGGGTVAVSVKSGTNAYRGSLAANYRPKAFNQNILANRLNNIAKPDIHLYDGTGTFGGPVSVPSIYSGKNRTFFFYSYEYWHSAEAAASNSRVPTPKELAGDFSESINGVAGGQIFDPFNVVNGVRQPFPGNIIPADRINPLAKAYLGFFPSPTLTLAPFQTGNNFNAPGNQRGDRYYVNTLRVDHNIGNSRLMGSYGYNHRQELRALNGLSFESSGTSRHYRINNVLNLELTTTYGNKVQKISGGWTQHFRHDDAGGEQVGYDSTQLGYPASFVSTVPARFFPVAVNGFPTIGGSAGLKQKSNDYYAQYELTQLHGKHSFKYGAEYRELRDLGQSALDGIGMGSFAFNRNFTSNSTVDSPANSTGGNAFASFLLGVPAFSTTNAAAGGSITTTPVNHYFGGYLAAYVQDDWRVSRRLTLNLGLRYDYDMLPGEQSNQIIKGFDQTVANPFVCTPCAAISSNVITINGVTYSNPALANFKGGMTFPDNSPLYKRDLNNFGPRAAATYQLTNKMVLRGGYGLTYISRANDGRQTGGVYSKQTPLVTSTNNGVSPLGTINNTAWNQLYPVILPIDGAQKGLLASIGSGFNFDNQDRSNPMFHSYSVDLQIQMPFRSVVTVGYVGSRTTDLQRTLQVNDVPLDVVRQLNVPDPLDQTRTILNRPVPNPFLGLVPDNPTLNRATTISVQNLLRPFPQYAAGIGMQNSPIGWQKYNGLQITWEKRLSHGLSALVSYTGSRTIESTGPLNQGESQVEQLTSQNRPHVLKLSGAWTAPALTGHSNLVRWTLGGWQASTITTVRSGVVIGMPDNVDMIGDPVLKDATFARSFNTCTLTVAGARQNCADPGTADATREGDVQRGPLTPVWQLRSVGAPDTTTSRLEGVFANEPFYFDVSFSKFVTVSSKTTVRIAFDLYNATGATQFNAPNTNVNDANGNFGRTTVTTQSNDPRKAQLSIRVTF